MAQLFICTLSESNSNDIDAQQWLLNKMCNRLERLGKVTLTTMHSTYSEISELIRLLVEVYSASHGDYYGIRDQLQASLKKYEENCSAEQIERAHERYRTAGVEFENEMDALDERRDWDALPDNRYNF